MQDLTSSSPIRAALYARVSTEEQREGQTIDSQIAELEKFASQRNWTVLGVYKDEGWSGSVLARPELDRLRDDAAKRLFHIVLINDVDRLARDVTHLGVVRRDLERNGIRLVFPKLPLEDNPNSKFMMNIFGSFAEFERELIADRTRRGRRYKAEVRKEYVGCAPPFGYRYTPIPRTGTLKGRMEIDERAAAIVRAMFTWVDEEGLSCLGVMRRLNQLKIPTPKGFTQWRSSTVHRMLRCETYAGLWHYGKAESVEPLNPLKPAAYRKALKSARRFRPRSEWIPVVLPEELHIIERSSWERVQRRLDKNSTFSLRHSKHNYMLRGLIRCGACKARYIGDQKAGKYRRYYYKCGAECKAYEWVREECLNDAVWDSVKKALCAPEVIEKYIQKLGRSHKQRHAFAKEDKSQHAVLLRDLELKELQAIEAYRAGSLSSPELARTLDDITRQKKTADASQGQLWEKAPVPVIKRTLADYGRKISEAMESTPPEKRQQILRLLVSEIVFEGARARITGALPLDPSPKGPLSRSTNPSNDGSIVGIASPHSRGMERNPDKMEFEILVPVKLGVFKSPRKNSSH